MSLFANVLIGVIALTGASHAWRQDLVTVAPDAAKIEYEDARVRVVRLRIAPNASLPMHDRPARVVIPLTRNARPQVFPFDELHYQGRRLLDDPVDLGDVLMVERRQCFGLTLEPRQPLGIGGKELRKDLDRHVAIELCVARTIDLAHATGAER